MGEKTRCERFILSIFLRQSCLLYKGGPGSLLRRKLELILTVIQNLRLKDNKMSKIKPALRFELFKFKEPDPILLP